MSNSNFILKSLVFLLLLTTFSPTSILSHAKVIYDEHCGKVVPQSVTSAVGLSHNSGGVYVDVGYASGGDKILKTSSSSAHDRPVVLPGRFRFYPYESYQTKTLGTFRLTGQVSVDGDGTPASGRSPFYYSGRHRIHDDSFMVSFNYVHFTMSGFWSNSSGKLCMVGVGYTGSGGRGWHSSWSGQGTGLKPTAQFVFNYPNSSNIRTSIASGRIKSIDPVQSPNYFDTIVVSAYAPYNYNYTLIPRVRDILSPATAPAESLGFATKNFNEHIWPRQWKFRLAPNCHPFPTFMSLSRFYSDEDGRVHMHIGFSNSSRYVGENALIPNVSLVGEGYWDSDKKLLGLVACPVMNTMDPLSDFFVGECTIGIRFWFPKVVSIRNSSSIIGALWSLKGKGVHGYFSPISFRSYGDKMGAIPGVKYEYTEVESLIKTCEERSKATNTGSERYPNENSIEDFKFDLTVKNATGSSMSGSAILLSFGDNFFGESFSRDFTDVSFRKEENKRQTPWSVSYRLSYSNSGEYTDIAAEGAYDSATGTFCMMGCRDLSYSEMPVSTRAEGYADCQIQITMQLSPLHEHDSEHHVNGTIRSTRDSSDALYFAPLEISSDAIYAEETRETIRRMDIETIMFVLSLSLSCIFIVFQIFYARKHHYLVSSISITMLVVLALCHMIPLLLSFRTLFLLNGGKRRVMLWNNRWLEVKDFVMRIMTMAAFLLVSRLLQLAWTARSSNIGVRNGLRIFEMKISFFCVLLYIAGGLIAWFVQSNIWSCIGLVHDGFLLPQIFLNAMSSSKDKALTPIFYVGYTVVRALPHVYDAYRARNYVPNLDFSYVYGNPEGDYYSTAWDVIIPLVGVLFAAVIYFQQKLGGGCVIPKRFRKLGGGYEAVPAIGLESF